MSRHSSRSMAGAPAGAAAAATTTAARRAAEQQCAAAAAAAPLLLRRSSSSRAAAMTTPLLLLLLIASALLLPPASLALTVHVGSRARQQLAEHVRHLPPRGDALEAMTAAERRAWAVDLKATAAETAAALRAGAPVTVTVDVKLVGFDGDGNGGLVVRDHELQAHLRSLRADLETVALRDDGAHAQQQQRQYGGGGPGGASSPAGGGADPLPAARASVEFRVQPAFHEVAPAVDAALERALTAAAAQHAESTAFSDAPLALIAPDAVDAVLRDDWSHSAAGVPSYVLYVLNPKAGAGRRYAYAYDSAHRSCPGALWLSPERRYGFLDLGANTTFAGPGPGGRGQALAHAVPALSHYRPEAAARAIVPDLAALVWGAARHLAWPPLAHPYAEYHASVAVHVVCVRNDLGGAEPCVDRGRIEEELRAAVGGAQQIDVWEHQLPVGQCAECVTAVADALRVRTLKPRERREGSGVDPLRPVQYLDARSLEDFVRDWGEHVLALAGANHYEHRNEGAHILPVFVFDTSAGSSPVLLDGWRQAVALPAADGHSAVVAVVGGTHTVPTFFGCHQKQLHLDPSDATRAVLAATLQAGWAVAETALAWSPATGRSWAWLWAHGPTPFGPLSALATLSFVQRDAALRNLAVLALNASSARAAALVDGVAKFAGADALARHVLEGPDDVAAYNERVALLLHKQAAAAAALGRLDHAGALGYALSMRADADGLERLMRRAKKGLSVELQCHGARERRRAWALPGGAALLCLALIAWRVVRGARGGGGGGGIGGFGGGGKSHSY